MSAMDGASLDRELTASAMLSARSVAEDAESAALSLPLSSAAVFEPFYSYLIVDEPAIHLMPLHFLPEALRERVGKDSLHELAVAAKLEYTRNRWLDEMVDDPSAEARSLSTHQLNDAILGLINQRYTRVFEGSTAASFFRVLADLYARHGLSLVLDGRRSGRSASQVTFGEYVEHAKMRHGPVRAPLDAVLLLTGAGDSELERARACWHNWALGVQFYDDALDVEEDYRDGNVSWAVSRTLGYFSAPTDNLALLRRMPDRDVFYERALVEGVIFEVLTHAESFFAESARLAWPTYSSWAALQQACLNQAQRLRKDYEHLLSEA